MVGCLIKHMILERYIDWRCCYNASNGIQ